MNLFQRGWSHLITTLFDQKPDSLLRHTQQGPVNFHLYSLKQNANILAVTHSWWMHCDLERGWSLEHPFTAHICQTSEILFLIQCADVWSALYPPRDISSALSTDIHKPNLRSRDVILSFCLVHGLKWKQSSSWCLRISRKWSTRAIMSSSLSKWQLLLLLPFGKEVVVWGCQI